jgi:hypothetical protein
MTTVTNTKKTTIRSIQELTARYARFCANNDFSADVTPENQYAFVETERQQKWLDAHMTNVEQAEMQGVRLARGRTDVVREIANDIADATNTPSTVKKVVNVVKAIAQKAVTITINSVFIDTPLVRDNTLCTAPAPVVDKRGQYGFTF